MIGDLLECQSWQISTRGVRHGVLREGGGDKRFEA